jgi:3-deoxy-manno-octulosonate cytidylyltransferase (CMP-KDO synthetase)
MISSGATIILPARYHSTRFPGKPLAVIAGKPLIEWVYQRASEVQGVSRILVATDHDDIASVVRGFGGDVVMTSADHATGTDRVAAVARELDDDIIVNLQGDEPLFPPALVEEMIAVLAGGARVAAKGPDPVAAGPRVLPVLEGSPNSPPVLANAPRGAGARSAPPATTIDIVTACHPITDPDEINNPNVVKVVMDREGRAMYFSRSAIPFARDNRNERYYRHIGIYVFRRESLIRFAELEATPLEKAESLEQLRALENGMTIRLVETEYSTVGVDVPEDTKTVEKALTTTYSQ